MGGESHKLNTGLYVCFSLAATDHQVAAHSEEDDQCCHQNCQSVSEIRLGLQETSDCSLTFSNLMKLFGVQEWSVCNQNVEMIWLGMDLRLTPPTYVGALYRSRNGNIDNFLDILQNLLIDIQGLGGADQEIMDDFNINSLLKRDSKNKKYQGLLQCLKLSALVHEATCITVFTSACIDHMLTNRQSLYNNVGVFDLGLFDHAHIYLSRKKKKPNVRSRQFNVMTTDTLTL